MIKQKPDKEADAVDIGEQTLELAERICVYQILADIYRREPDKDLFDRLVIPEALVLFKDISNHPDNDILDIAHDIHLEELGIEFCRLFIGPGPHVAPYESVNRTEAGNAGKLWGDATVQMKHMVESLGLSYAEDFHEMPDHLSVEFELMYRLLVEEMAALGADDMVTAGESLRAQNVLFKEHVGTWLQGFCDKLEATTNNRFYTWVARLTRDFMISEGEIYA